MISGICYEHHQNAVGCLKLDSMDAIRDVHTKVAADECHVASEALIVMAQPYDSINYLPIPLIGIATTCMFMNSNPFHGVTNKLNSDYLCSIVSCTASFIKGSTNPARALRSLTVTGTFCLPF